MGIKETMTMQEALAMKQQLEQVFSIVRLLDRETLETGRGVEEPCQCYSKWGKATFAFPGRHLSRYVRIQK